MFDEVRRAQGSAQCQAYAERLRQHDDAPLRGVSRDELLRSQRELGPRCAIAGRDVHGVHSEAAGGKLG